MTEDRPIVNSPPQTRSGRQRGEKPIPFIEDEISLFKVALKDHGENWAEIAKVFIEKKFERDEEQIKQFFKTNGRKYKFKEILKEREVKKEVKKEEVIEAVKVEIKAETAELRVEIKDEPGLPKPTTPPRIRSPGKFGVGIELPTIGGIPLPTPRVGPDSPKVLPKPVSTKPNSRPTTPVGSRGIPLELPLAPGTVPIPIPKPLPNSPKVSPIVVKPASSPSPGQTRLSPAAGGSKPQTPPRQSVWMT